MGVEQNAVIAMAARDVRFRRICRTSMLIIGGQNNNSIDNTVCEISNINSDKIVLIDVENPNDTNKYLQKFVLLLIMLGMG